MKNYLALLLYCFLLPLFAFADDPVRIGLLVPLSGPYADLGEDCRFGIEVARRGFAPSDKVGSHQVEFHYEDSQADPKTGILGYKKLVEEKNVLAIVTIRSPIGMAINPSSKRDHVSLLGGVGHKDFVSTNKYAFQLWASTPVEGSTLAEGMVARGDLVAAVLTTEDEWTMSLTEGFKNRFLGLGGELIFDETVPPSEMNLSTVLTKAFSKNPDAIFLDLGVAQIPVAVRRARELGYKKTIYSNFWSGSADVARAAGDEMMDGVIFPEMVVSEPKFSAALATFSDKRPNAAAYSCYTATAMTIEGIKNVSSNLNRDTLYDALTKVKVVPLLDSPLEIIDRRGNFKMGLKEVQENKIAELAH